MKIECVLMSVLLCFKWQMVFKVQFVFKKYIDEVDKFFVIVCVWVGLVYGVGGFFCVFGFEMFEKDDCCDGFFFLFVLFVVFGVVNEWFFIGNEVVVNISVYFVGFFVGCVVFIMLVLFLFFVGWLFCYFFLVYDNGCIGIGFGMFVFVFVGIFYVVGL